jgi:hypothetical protein
MDYLEDELTAYYQSESNDPNRDPVEFRPAAEEHLRKLESLRLSQLLAISTILDSHLATLVRALLEVPAEDLDLDLARELLVMMSDYVERQLPQLSPRSLMRFYEALLQSVVALTLHLQEPHPSSPGQQIPVMVAVLTLLDNLATQEFCVPSVVASEDFLGSAVMIGEEIHISEVVGVSLLLFSRVWSQETLEHFCDLQKAYFSLLLYTLSSASSELLLSCAGHDSSSSKLFRAIGMGEEEVLRSLNSVYSVLIWGISSHYPSTPRLAMQGIQLCAIVGIKTSAASATATDSYHDLLTRFLWHCQDTFLYFLGNKYDPSSPLLAANGTTTSPQQQKTNGISWERVDAISSTFLSVIAFDVQRYPPSCRCPPSPPSDSWSKSSRSTSLTSLTTRALRKSSAVSSSGW